MTQPSPASTGTLTSDRLERVFAECFADTCHTVLVGGADEPLYVPGSGSEPHTLYYREDFFASALHETAHWCIAGPERRKLPDFGYWYAQEGRDSAAQRAFEAVEAKPQALEWIFSQACGWPFRVSTDNFDPHTGAAPDARDFCMQVVAQARSRQSQGLPARAARFYQALGIEFGTAQPLEALHFALADLL